MSVSLNLKNSYLFDGITLELNVIHSTTYKQSSLEVLNLNTQL